MSTIIFNPLIPVVYQGNIIIITIINPDRTLTYEWKPYNRIYLDDNYVQTYGTLFKDIFYSKSTYIVNGVSSDGTIISSSNITI